MLRKDLQQGIGSALVKKGHQLAQALQFPYSIVLGDPQYYSRFGYQAAKNWCSEICSKTI